MNLLTVSGLKKKEVKPTNWQREGLEMAERSGWNAALAELEKMVIDEEKLAKELWVFHCTKHPESTIHFMSAEQIERIWIQINRSFREEFIDDAKAITTALPSLFKESK